MWQVRVSLLNVVFGAMVVCWRTRCDLPLCSVVLSSKLEVRQIPGRGRGLAAVADIFPGEMLIQTPLRDGVVARRWDPLPPSKVPLRTWRRWAGNQQARLAMRLLGRGAHSFVREGSWRESPAFWPNDVLRAVGSPTFYFGALGAREEFEALERDLSPCFSAEAVRDAYHAARSRCFAASIPGRFFGSERAAVLMPGLDLLNHSPYAKLAKFHCQARKLTLRTEQPWREGEEVCIRYGDFANDQLLLAYGFLCHQNPHDSFELPVSCLGESWRERLRGLESISYARVSGWGPYGSQKASMKLLRSELHELLRELDLGFQVAVAGLPKVAQEYRHELRILIKEAAQAL